MTVHRSIGVLDRTAQSVFLFSHEKSEKHVLTKIRRKRTKIVSDNGYSREDPLENGKRDKGPR